MTKVKHVLGISGGKDSAALAIYMQKNYPEIDIEYYSCDTGKELDETYELIDNLEVHLGKKIKVLRAAEGSSEDPFDHFLQVYGGYLPSSMARWCTKKLKLDPFEKYLVGDEPVISYVGIRGDEEREGYVSTKPNVQAIFPFRRNIWSQDVISKVITNNQIPFLISLYNKYAADSPNFGRILEIVGEPISPLFGQKKKVDNLLEVDTKAFNKIVFAFLKTTDLPLSRVESFPLVESDDVLVRDDIFRILRESGVGVPAYYEKREYKVEIDGEEKIGHYSRSRSGCFFCFFQQKIEWVWLYENHKHRYEEAMGYEKDGYTWQQGETLEELADVERRKQIKIEHYKRMIKNELNESSPYLVDILDDAEEEGCQICFG